MSIETTKNIPTHFFRVAKGALFADALLAFVQKEGIPAATCSAIGAVEDVVLAYYNLETRAYEEKQLEDVWELVALTGNIATKEGSPFLHAHVVVSDPDMQTRGGHLVSCTVAATVEVTLHPLPKAITRSFDEVTGLHLLDIPTLGGEK